MPQGIVSSFETLRLWNGEQSRAFEEICYQLLKSVVPAGARAIRTGNPDGGVEWYATLVDGTEWGWQAKHVHGIDALLTAMTDSVKRVASERTALRKLTFAISWNLGTGTSGGRRRSAREKYEEKIATWRRDIPGADQIEFELIQESDLLDELAKPEHAGRRWLWWDQLVLGYEWLVEQYRRQAEAAADKYRPDLQVDIPIQDDLVAVGFDRDVINTYRRLLRAVVDAVVDVKIVVPANQTSATEGDGRESRLYQAVRDTMATLKNWAEHAIDLHAGDSGARLDALRGGVVSCQEAINDAQRHEQSAADATRRRPGSAQGEVAPANSGQADGDDGDGDRGGDDRADGDCAVGGRATQAQPPALVRPWRSMGNEQADEDALTAGAGGESGAAGGGRGGEGGGRGWRVLGAPRKSCSTGSRTRRFCVIGRDGEFAGNSWVTGLENWGRFRSRRLPHP